MRSRITNGTTTHLFSGTLLGKYRVDFFQCDDTGFIQTEEPYWLDEAYASAITALDIGLLDRNQSKVKLSERILPSLISKGDRMLDYGGGYGVYVRLMRDRGFPFELYDPHCEAIFAKDFQLHSSDWMPCQFAAITAWEVFEHIPDPMDAFENLTKHSDCILFSTILIPQSTPSSIVDWWYFSPETGQHVSFYSLGSLEWIAKTLKFHLYTDGVANHLLVRRPITKDPFRTSWLGDFLSKAKNRLCRYTGMEIGSVQVNESLITSDYQKALSRLQALQTEPGTTE